MTTRQINAPFTQSSLACQIRDAVSKHLLLAPLEQLGAVEHCNGPEELSTILIRNLDTYSPSILRLPIALVLMEVTNYHELESQLGARKVKRLLKRLTFVLRRALRAYDVLVRYRRNSFACLLLGADEEMAGKICQRLKEAALRYCYLKSNLRTKASFEFAVAEHNVLAGNDIDDLVFSNDRTIRFAHALGDGVVVRRHELKEAFREHRSLHFCLGDDCAQTGVFEYE